MNVSKDMNLVQQYDAQNIEKMSKIKEIPAFKAGDTLRVHLKIKDGNSERVQSFEGVCIGRKQRSISSTFRVRKISHGNGVEKILPLYSELVSKIEVLKCGRVRRSKLFYLRDLQGKAARIKEVKTW